MANKINIKLTSHIKGIEIVKILSDISPLPKKAFTDRYDNVVRKVDKIKKIFIWSDFKSSVNILKNLKAYNYFSKKLFNCLDLLGCLSFRKALASICLILSLVTENCKPTSSNV